MFLGKSKENGSEPRTTPENIYLDLFSEVVFVSTPAIVGSFEPRFIFMSRIRFNTDEDPYETIQNYEHLHTKTVMKPVPVR